MDRHSGNKFNWFCVPCLPTYIVTNQPANVPLRHPLFLTILIEIIAPIVVLILLGFLFERRFSFDLDALTKILLYLVLPAVIITSLSRSDLSTEYVRHITVFCVLMFVALFVVSTIISLAMRHDRELSRAFNLSVMFYNSGNYGFPVSGLAFPGLGLPVQAIVLVVQNVLNFTVGLLLITSGRNTWRESLRKTLRMPLMYAILFGWGIRVFEIQVPGFIWLPIEYLAQALIPMALVTLGFQLGKTRIGNALSDGLASVFCRLIVSPVIGLGLVLWLEIPTPLASILVVSTSYPTAINTVLIAMELKNKPEFAATAVFLSTVFSVLTVALTIYAVRMYGV